MFCNLVHYVQVEVIGFSAFNCSRMYNILSYMELNTQMIFCAGLVPCKHPIVYHELGPVRKKQYVLFLSRIMYSTDIVSRSVFFSIVRISWSFRCEFTNETRRRGNLSTSSVVTILPLLIYMRWRSYLYCYSKFPTCSITKQLQLSIV